MEKCTAPNITYCGSVIGTMVCEDCKWFKEVKRKMTIKVTTCEIQERVYEGATAIEHRDGVLEVVFDDERVPFSEGVTKIEILDWR